MPKRTLSHAKEVMSELTDDDYAVAYLNAAIEEADASNDPRGVLVALRRIAEAKGMGMTKLAKDLEVDRAGLYRILSEQGNPEFLTLFGLFKALGMQMSVKKLA